MTDIPGGWTSLPLRDVLSMTIGGIWGESEGLGDVDVRVIRVTELRPNGGLDQSTAVTRSVSLKQFESRRLFDGDLLLEKSGGGPKTPVGRVALVVGSPQSAVCANFMQLMRPNREVVEPRYLHLFLMFLHQSGGTVAFQTATTNIRNIKMADYMATDIPLPPLDEQRRIVAILEDHLTRLEVAHGAVSAAQSRLDSMQRSAAQQLVFAGDAGHGPRRAIAEIAELVTDGDHNPPKRVAFGVPHITAKGVRGGRINEEGCSFVSEEGFLQTSSRYLPRDGDVIVTCVGTIGRVAVVPAGLRFSADRNLAAIRLKPDVARPRYLEIALNSAVMQSRMALASGSTAQPHLYLRDIRSLEIPVPPLDVQDAVIEFFEVVQAAVEGASTAVSIVARRANALRRSLLQAAFSGQLTKEPSVV